MAARAGTVSFGAKKASRGGKTVCGTTVHAAAGTTGRGGPRCRSMASIRALVKAATPASSSAMVGMGPSTSRSAISIGMPRATRSASTA